MTEHVHSIRENLNAPHELVDAVAKGEPYRRSARAGDSKRRHVQRFSAAIAVYVCMALLLIGTVTLLPSIFEKDEPQPAVTDKDATTPTLGSSDPISPDKITSPESLFNVLLSADEAIVTSTETVASDWLDSEATHTYTLDGSLMAIELPDFATYSDFANQKAYAEYPDVGWVVTDTYGASWEDTVADIFGMVPYAIEDKNYAQKDGKYVFTEKAIDRMLIDYDFYTEMIVLAVGEQFETEIVFEQTNEGAVWRIRYWSETGTMSTVIDVRFVDTTVTLPDEAADAKPLEDEDKKFTPDLLCETLDSGIDLTVSAERQLYKIGKITEQTAVFERDGDKVRMTERSDLGETVSYLDMANGLEYSADEDGWLAKGTDCTSWNDVMEAYIFGIEPTFLFDSGNYIYNNGSYDLTEAAVEALSAELSGNPTVNETFGGSVEVSTMIAHYSDGVTETWVVEKFTSRTEGSGWESVRYTITFGDATVDLPA